jgi:hypothetical protein
LEFDCENDLWRLPSNPEVNFEGRILGVKMSRQIPGYYYGQSMHVILCLLSVADYSSIKLDDRRKKYFKIEKSGTAPSNAAWSAENVKRRKIEDKQARIVKHRQNLIRRHVKRAGVLREPLMGGFLNRELGVPFRESIHVPSAAWGAGLTDKGLIPFELAFPLIGSPNISCFYVNGDDEETGLGVAYGSKSKQYYVSGATS